MAQFYTDFSTQTADQFPAGWTAWISKQTGWTIVNTANFGKCLSHTDSTGVNGRKALTWDVVPSAADVEVYMEVGTTTLSSAHEKLAALRLDPAKNTSVGTVHLYGAGYKDGNIESGRYNDGTYALITSANDPDSSNFLSSTYIHCIRTKLSGSSLQVKSWPKTGPEPTAWEISSTDVVITAAGLTGIYALAGLNNTFIIAYGVGTGNDTAPIAPVSSAIHQLSAISIQSLTQVSTPSIGGATTHVLDAEDATSSSTTNSANFVQTYNFGIVDVESLFQLSDPVLTNPSQHDFFAISIESSSEVTVPVAATSVAGARLQANELLHTDKWTNTLLNITGCEAWVLNPIGHTLSKYFASVNVVGGVLEIQDALYTNLGDGFIIVLIKGNIGFPYPATVVS